MTLTLQLDRRGHPVEAQGEGGRQVRIGKEVGEIFDHHAVEFTYANGVKLFSYCRQIPGCWGAYAQHAHGTKGKADIQGFGNAVLYTGGKEAARWKQGRDGHQVEMDDLFAALVAGRPYNEADWAVESTMTAILGRMATYSGQYVKWDDAMKSQISLCQRRCCGMRTCPSSRDRTVVTPAPPSPA